MQGFGSGVISSVGVSSLVGGVIVNAFKGAANSAGEILLLGLPLPPPFELLLALRLALDELLPRLPALELLLPLAQAAVASASVVYGPISPMLLL